MFRIRFFTPAVLNEEGWQHAGGELVVGNARMCFLVDVIAVQQEMLHGTREPVGRDGL